MYTEGYGCKKDVYGLWDQVRMPIYEWNNGAEVNCYNPGYVGHSCSNGMDYVVYGPHSPITPIQPNRDVYNFSSGTNCPGENCTQNERMGVGTTLPVHCTPGTVAGDVGYPGVGFWKVNEGNWNQSGNGYGNGRLYRCTATDTWTLYYTPYTYPHPLRTGISDTVAPAAPSGLVVN